VLQCNINAAMHCCEFTQAACKSIRPPKDMR